MKSFVFLAVVMELIHIRPNMISTKLTHHVIMIVFHARLVTNHVPSIEFVQFQVVYNTNCG